MRDLEKVYDNEISPLVAQIIAIAKQEGMPMFASFLYADGQICSTWIPSDDREEREEFLASFVERVWPEMTLARKPGPLFVNEYDEDGKLRTSTAVSP